MVKKMKIQQPVFALIWHVAPFKGYFPPRIGVSRKGVGQAMPMVLQLSNHQQFVWRK